MCLVARVVSYDGKRLNLDGPRCPALALNAKVGPKRPATNRSAAADCRKARPAVS
jgi:hypothetical protein